MYWEGEEREQERLSACSDPRAELHAAKLFCPFGQQVLLSVCPCVLTCGQVGDMKENSVFSFLTLSP